MRMPIPNDPIILMSYLNTQLRDHYSSLEDLCKSMDLDASEIAEKLKDVGYVYHQERNQFVTA
ncbi:DUF4250 domain-containing protein [Ruminococcus sp.]|jgi:thermostable 8-oxoguanine DNA glycosylase|uniref:DUF4250 domain-containing protein n=2 Tax=Ruminococcus TaxID=1263 RepID=UPI0025F1AA56|nr:DUF4250 domain-containing protein [Ruminococcus sp.]MEE0023230.1 DUF4250 domain-containing protein [Ruminococcus sp.]